MSEVLKACPFCGSQPKLEILSAGRPDAYRKLLVLAVVQCPDCKVEYDIGVWDNNIRPYIPDDCPLWEGDHMHPTARRAAIAGVRQALIDKWNARGAPTASG